MAYTYKPNPSRVGATNAGFTIYKDGKRTEWTLQTAWEARDLVRQLNANPSKAR